MDEAAQGEGHEEGQARRAGGTTSARPTRCCTRLPPLACASGGDQNGPLAELAALTGEGRFPKAPHRASASPHELLALATPLTAPSQARCSEKPRGLPRSPSQASVCRQQRATKQSSRERRQRGLSRVQAEQGTSGSLWPLTLSTRTHSFGPRLGLCCPQSSSP